MELSEEIIASARSLGQVLRQDRDVQAYLKTLADIEADPEAHALEKHLFDLYCLLTTRQLAGEQISRAEIDEFYQMGSQMQAHPRISRRNAMLRALNPFLADTADEISAQLGLDYVNLVTAESQ